MVRGYFSHLDHQRILRRSKGVIPLIESKHAPLAMKYPEILWEVYEKLRGEA